MSDSWVAAMGALLLLQAFLSALILRGQSRRTSSADLSGPAGSERPLTIPPPVDSAPVRRLDRALRAEVCGLSRGDWQRFDLAAAAEQLERALERCAQAEERYANLEDRAEGMLAELSAAAQTLADSVAQQLSAARSDLDLAVRGLNNQRQLQELRFEQLAGDLQLLLRELRATRPAPASCQVTTLRPPPSSR